MCPYGKTCIYKHDGVVSLSVGTNQTQSWDQLPFNLLTEEEEDNGVVAPETTEGEAGEIKPVAEPENSGFVGYGDGLLPSDPFTESYVLEHTNHTPLDMVIPFDTSNMMGGVSEEISHLMVAYNRVYANWVDSFMKGVAPTHFGIKEIARVNLPNITSDVRDFTKRTHEIEADSCLFLIKYELRLLWDSNVSSSGFQRMVNRWTGRDFTGLLTDFVELGGPLSLKMLVTKVVSSTLVDSVLSRSVNSPLAILPTILSRMNRDATLNTPTNALIMRDSTEFVALHYFAANRNNGIMCTTEEVARIMPSLRR
jgi:hypothetical protein